MSTMRPFPAVRLRSRALIASSGLRLESGGQEDAVLLVLSTWVASLVLIDAGRPRHPV
jgi:hypothetical protein